MQSPTLMEKVDSLQYLVATMTAAGKELDKDKDGISPMETSIKDKEE